MELFDTQQPWNHILMVTFGHFYIYTIVTIRQWWAMKIQTCSSDIGMFASPSAGAAAAAAAAARPRLKSGEARCSRRVLVFSNIWITPFCVYLHLDSWNEGELPAGKNTEGWVPHVGEGWKMRRAGAIAATQGSRGGPRSRQDLTSSHTHRGPYTLILRRGLTIRTCLKHGVWGQSSITPWPHWQGRRATAEVTNNPPAARGSCLESSWSLIDTMLTHVKWHFYGFRLLFLALNLHLAFWIFTLKNGTDPPGPAWIITGCSVLTHAGGAGDPCTITDSWLLLLGGTFQSLDMHYGPRIVIINSPTL